MNESEAYNLLTLLIDCAKIMRAVEEDLAMRARFAAAINNHAPEGVCLDISHGKLMEMDRIIQTIAKIAGPDVDLGYNTTKGQRSIVSLAFAAAKAYEDWEGEQVAAGNLSAVSPEASWAEKAWVELSARFATHGICAGEASDVAKLRASNEYLSNVNYHLNTDNDKQAELIQYLQQEIEIKNIKIKELVAGAAPTRVVFQAVPIGSRFRQIHLGGKLGGNPGIELFVKIDARRCVYDPKAHPELKCENDMTALVDISELGLAQDMEVFVYV